MDDAALIDHESRSVSEIPLVRRISSTLSSSAGGLSPPREPATSCNSTSGGSDDAPPVSREPVGAISSPATATAAATTDEDVVSKVDLAIMASTVTLLMTMTVTIGGLGWKTPWKVLYDSLMIVSFVSTITGFITAVVRTGRSSRLSPFCARLGLLVAAAQFVVFLSCKLPSRFGCLGGVAAAAVVVVVLAVAWVLSEPPTAVAPAAAEEEGTSVV